MMYQASGGGWSRTITGPVHHFVYNSRVAQLVRAVGLHPACRGFESLSDYQNFLPDFGARLVMYGHVAHEKRHDDCSFGVG